MARDTVPPLVSSQQPVLWGRGLAWLALLAPLFFISYNYANQYAASLPHVPSVAFSWEAFMPLLPWTIVPYWSIDLLYGLAFMLPRHAKAVDTLGLRLLTAQLICIACFMLWPLHFSFTRPELDGVFGAMFDALMGFDKPYNQAPSLHITLMVVLWACYGRYLTGWWRWLVHAWFALIGLSVLTTWQHHFIDVPTGLLAGLLCLWCWPSHGACPARKSRQAQVLFANKRRKMAACYGVGAILVLAFMAGAIGLQYYSSLLLLWPSLALLIVALNYLYCGADGFQKGADGEQSLAAYWLLLPYRVGAWINSRLWTKHQDPSNHILANIYLGRRPSVMELSNFQGVLDLCAEFPASRNARKMAPYYASFPLLDLVPLSAMQCWQVGNTLRQLKQQQPGNLLVFCALGYSRSATAVMAWLLIDGKVNSVEQALALVQQGRPQVVIKPAQLAQLNLMCQLAEFNGRKCHDNPEQ
ncbi:phosphatase PAP2/dual specificity phosphatase family protein [Motilimonas pumila]|uniref:Phosphatase PAP2 family protein n=1 Tax=Motilimonas pumila TaxID=2303987 RepID=A0A418YEN4_9GAMM|nr:phosphatase PAP2/dual specificity phosphatase family protein [Motilimonas pumila]RJG47616.1 phosphatase PAP2 family protein [Motilimonas pumila]